MLPIEIVYRYLFSNLTEIWHRQRSRSWPTTQAEIVAANSRGAEVSVTYLYVVKGNYFSGTMMRDCVTKASSEYVCKRYPAHGAAAVYYDSKHPERSYLPSGVGWLLEDAP